MLFTNTVEVVHVHGPMPRFGRFVRRRLRAGVRGPRLYQEIRTEHERRPRGWAKGHYRHPHGGPPAHRGGVRMDVHGGRPHIASVRVEGGSPRVRVHGGGGGWVQVRGGGPGRPGGSVRVRAGGGSRGGGGGRGLASRRGRGNQLGTGRRGFTGSRMFPHPNRRAPRFG